MDEKSEGLVGWQRWRDALWCHPSSLSLRPSCFRSIAGFWSEWQLCPRECLCNQLVSMHLFMHTCIVCIVICSVNPSVLMLPVYLSTKSLFYACVKCAHVCFVCVYCVHVYFQLPIWCCYVVLYSLLSNSSNKPVVCCIVHTCTHICTDMYTLAHGCTQVL